jgi:hypothetical protein
MSEKVEFTADSDLHVSGSNIAPGVLMRNVPVVAGDFGGG